MRQDAIRSRPPGAGLLQFEEEIRIRTGRSRPKHSSTQAWVRSKRRGAYRRENKYRICGFRLHHAAHEGRYPG